MSSVDLSTREYEGHVVVALRGELDMVDAARVAAALAEVAVRVPEIIVDLAALEFIDSSGVAALAHGRRQAWRAGGDLTLAAPQQQVLKVLSLTRLANAFSVHASVDEATGRAGHSRPVTVPVPPPASKILQATLSSRAVIGRPVASSAAASALHQLDGTPAPRAPHPPDGTPAPSDVTGTDPALPPLFARNEPDDPRL